MKLNWTFISWYYSTYYILLNLKIIWEQQILKCHIYLWNLEILIYYLLFIVWLLFIKCLKISLTSIIKEKLSKNAFFNDMFLPMLYADNSRVYFSSIWFFKLLIKFFDNKKDRKMRKQLNIVIYLKTEKVLNYDDLEIWDSNKLKITMFWILK
jgi:hypothetical protein